MNINRFPPKIPEADTKGSRAGKEERLTEGRIDAASKSLQNPPTSSDLKILPTTTNQTTKKSGLFSRIFSAFGRGLSALGRKTADVGEWAVEKACIKGGVDSEYKSTILRLKKLTGNDDIAMLLPSIAKTVFRSIDGTFDKGMFKTLIGDEEAVIENITLNIMAKMLANVGEHMQKQHPNEKINLLSMVAHFVNLVKTQIDIVKKEIDQKNPTALSREKAKLMQASMGTVFDNIMKIALPNGSQDLPVRFGVRTIVWKLLKSNVTPKLFSLAENIAQIDHFSRMEQMKKNPADKAPLRMIQEIGGIAKGFAQKMVGEPLLAEKVTEQICQTLNATHSKSIVKSLLLEGATSKNPDVEALWSYFETNVETVLSHIVYSMAQATKNPNVKPDDDPFTKAFHNAMQVICDFVNKNHETIQKLQKELVGQNLDPNKEKVYLDQFKGLGLDLQRLVGFDSGLPKVLQAYVTEFLHTTLLQLIAQNYPLITQIAELYNAQAHPKDVDVTLSAKLDAQKNGVELGRQCKQIGEFAASKTPQMLGSQAESLSKTLVTSITASLMGAQDKIRKSILEGMGVKEEGNANVKNEGDKAFEGLQTTLSGWIKVKMEGLSLQDPRLVNFWKFVDTSVTNLMMHMTANSKTEEHPNAVKICLNSLIDCFAHFSEKNGAALYLKYAELKAQNKDPKADQTFVAQFQPLCENILKALGDNLPLPNMLNQLIRSFIHEQGPALLADKFRETITPESSIKSYHERLKKLMVQKAADPVTEASQSKILELLDKSCGILADKVLLTINNKANEKLSQILADPNKVKAADKLAEEPSKDGVPRAKQIKDVYLSQSIKSLLLQALVHYLEGIQSGGVKLQEASLSIILTKLGQTLEKHLEEDANAIQKAATIVDPKLREKAMQAAFAPLSKNLIDLFRQPGAPKEGIPLNVPFASDLQAFWSDIEKTIVPDVLAQMYLDTTTWHSQIEVYRKSLASVNPKSDIPQACEDMAKWVSTFVPSFTIMERPMLASAIYETCRDSLKSSGDADQEAVHQYLMQNEQMIKEMFAGVFVSGFGKDTTGRTMMKPVLLEFSKGIFFKIFSTLATNAKSIEDPKDPKYQEGFLLKIGIRCLDTINQHFQTLQKVTEEHGERTAHSISTTQFIESFKKHGILNKGMPQTKEALEAYKDIKKYLSLLKKERALLVTLTAARKPDKAKIDKCKLTIKTTQQQLRKAKEIGTKERMKFYQPFSKALLDLVDIKSENDLPFPSPLRETLWKQLQEQLLPSILNSVYETIMDPSTINTMLIAGLTTMSEALNAEDELEKKYLSSYENMREVTHNLKASRWIAKNSNNKKFFNTELNSLLKKAVAAAETAEKILHPVSYKHIILDFKKHHADIKKNCDSVKATLNTILEWNANKKQPPIDLKIVTILTEAKTQLDTAQKDIAAIYDHVHHEEELAAKDDDTQRKLNAACGELVMQMLNLIPKSIVKVFFKIDRLQSMTAEMIGRSVRKQLGENWNLQKILEMGAQSLSKTMNPPQGLSFPENDDELEKQEAAKYLEIEKSEALVKELLYKMTHRAAGDSIITVSSSPIIWLKQKLDQAIDFIFRGYAPDVRNFFQTIINTIVYYITKLIELIPLEGRQAVKKDLWKVFDFCIRTKGKIDHFYNNLLIGIHENLLFNLSNELVASRNKDLDNLINPLKEAFEARKVKDAEANKKFEVQLDQDLASIKKAAEASPT